MTGSSIPDSDRIIFAAGEEVVLTRMQRETRDVLFMAFEIAEVGVVMSREISYGV